LERPFDAKVIRPPGERDPFDNRPQVSKDGGHTGGKAGQGV
jgi:hypothetical protein